MYLTRISIPAIDAAIHNLTNSYRWHQHLWKAFPGREDKTRDFLFRVNEKENRTIEVFLVSASAPIPVSPGAWDTKEIPPTHYEAKKYIFSLRYNPTTKVPRFDKNGNQLRQGTYRPVKCTEIEENFIRKAQRCGFRALDYRISSPLKEILTKKGDSQPQTITTVDVQGVIQVTDVNAFKRAAVLGVGRAKAYGCGLLLLKRISN